MKLIIFSPKLYLKLLKFILRYRTELNFFSKHIVPNVEVNFIA